MSRLCPVCGLVSPESAESCDCSYDFVTRTGGPRRSPRGLSFEKLRDRPALAFVAAAFVALAVAVAWPGAWPSPKELVVLSAPWMGAAVLVGPALGPWVGRACASLTVVAVMAADYTYQGPYLRHFLRSKYARARSAKLEGGAEARVMGELGHPVAPYPISERWLRWLAHTDHLAVVCADGRVVSLSCNLRVRLIGGKVYPKCEDQGG